MPAKTVLRDFVLGINLSEGPLYFASLAIKKKFKSIDFNECVISEAELLSSTLYHICNLDSLQDDVVKARIEERRLEKCLKEKCNLSSIWSSFLLGSGSKAFYRSGFLVKFDKESDESSLATTSIVKVAKLCGIQFISKLIPSTNASQYAVDVISCDTYESLERFEILPVKYLSDHHPLFDFGHSIFKSFEETQNVLDLANRYLDVPEIKTLQNLGKSYSKSNFPSKEAYPNPFIVVEGLDGVGKTTLASNLAKRLGAQILHTPPEIICGCRKQIVKQVQPVARAYYSLGNYLTAEIIKDTLPTSPVVLDRFWHSSAAYAIAWEAKCGGEESIPSRGNSIYLWPSDLLEPSAVFFLELNESARVLRMRERGAEEDNPEEQLTKSLLLRERLIKAYKNMENPTCIIIDAAKSREAVCEEVIKKLISQKIITERV